MTALSFSVQGYLLCAIALEPAVPDRYSHVLSLLLHHCPALLFLCGVTYHLRKKRQGEKNVLVYLLEWHTVGARFLKELCGTDTRSGAVRCAEQSMQMPAEIWLIMANAL